MMEKISWIRKVIYRFPRIKRSICREYEHKCGQCPFHDGFRCAFDWFKSCVETYARERREKLWREMEEKRK